MVKCSICGKEGLRGVAVCPDCLKRAAADPGQIQKLKQINNILNKTGFTDVLKVQPALITYTPKNRKKGYLGYKARPLNFCPECGKPVERNKTVWRI